MLDMAVLAEEIAAIVSDEVERAFVPIKAESARLEAKFKEMVDAAVAAIPPAAPGRSVTVEDVSPLIRDTVAAEVAALPVPRDGASITLGDVTPMILGAIEEAIAALPPAKDGKSVTIDDLAPLVQSAVAREVAALPPAKDGASVTVTDVEPLIREAAARLVETLPAPQDGASVTLEDVAPMIRAAVGEAVAALPAPMDGRGVAGALIDRGGSLILTLSDGTLAELGRVEGRDGDPGLGFEDMHLEHDGERSFAIVFVRGDREKRFEFAIPAVIDRGVYAAEREYGAGDGVTWGGSYWIAQRATTAKPDTAESGWRLAVKRGRDGRGPESR